MDDLLSMLEQCDKDVINEDDYNMSVVEDMVIKLIDMKNAIKYKHSVEIPRKGSLHHPTEQI